MIDHYSDFDTILSTVCFALVAALCIGLTVSYFTPKCKHDPIINLVSDHQGCKLFEVNSCSQPTIYYTDCGDSHWRVSSGKTTKQMSVQGGHK